ncbi:MAG TPA: flagellar basal-body MS-ring/collar protein FliF [Methylococcaceae bacterium]|nr:flagellar basal-body MS-ring/collar protein FliF [Methylococcaceae bacterium]
MEAGHAAKNAEQARRLMAGGGGNQFLAGLGAMSRGQQMAWLAGIALAIALAVAVVLWTRHADYSPLFGGMPDKDVAEVVEALDKLGMDYRVDSTTGAVKVPSGQVHEVRLRLAGQGLPRESGGGFELMEQDRGFGNSQLMETARYQHALEGEIARSIVTLDPVKAARVHLAFPKETVFVRERKKPSASVVVHLHAGRSLGKEQAQAIVHLVSSSVPQLDPESVTVVDQEGRLLSSRDTGGEMALSNKQFEHKREVEEYLIGRIENILSPLVGREGLRTQVSADIDFTVTERTQELFNPDQPAMRSEQTTEQQSRGGGGAQGVPGALSNQPPAAGTAPEVAGGQAGAAAAGGGSESLNRNSTRNFELDRTVSHSRLAVGGLRRLTAAVVVDNRRVRQEDGAISEKPYSEEELVRFTDLVKEALGYDVTRGDRVMVTNAPFKSEEAPPALKIWEEDWFWSAVRQGVALLALAAIILGVIRPLLKVASRAPEGGPAGLLGGPRGGLAADRLTLSHRRAGAEDEEPLLLESPEAAYQRHLDFAKKTVESDPKRVAQLIRTWMTANG